MPGENHVYTGIVMCGQRQGFRNFMMHWRRFVYHLRRQAVLLLRQEILVMHWQRFVRDYLRLERAEFHKGRIRSFFGDEDMRNRR
jgi:hypothetical protein